MEHKHESAVVSLDYASINKSTIYVTMHKRKAPINMLSCSKAPKTQQVGNNREKPADFFLLSNTSVNFSTCSHFANLVPLQKFPFLFSLQFFVLIDQQFESYLSMKQRLQTFTRVVLLGLQ